MPGICNNCQPIAFGSDHHRGITVGVGPWPKKCSRAWWPDPFRSYPKPNPDERGPPISPKALYRWCLPRLASALYHQSTRNISAILSLLEWDLLFYDMMLKSQVLEAKTAYMVLLVVSQKQLNSLNQNNSTQLASTQVYGRSLDLHVDPLHVSQSGVFIAKFV